MELNRGFWLFVVIMAIIWLATHLYLNHRERKRKREALRPDRINAKRAAQREREHEAHCFLVDAAAGRGPTRATASDLADAANRHVARTRAQAQLGEQAAETRLARARTQSRHVDTEREDAFDPFGPVTQPRF